MRWGAIEPSWPFAPMQRTPSPGDPFFGTYGGAADSLGYFSPVGRTRPALVTYTLHLSGLLPHPDSLLLLTVNP